MRPLSTWDPVSSSVLSRRSTFLRALATILVVCVPLASCGGGSMADLRSYVAEIKTRPGTPIEDLPPIQPYVVYTYPCDGADEIAELVIGPGYANGNRLNSIEFRHLLRTRLKELELQAGRQTRL